LRDQYRKYLKKLTTKSGQSASIKIPGWKYADEMSFVCPHLCERDTLTNLEFDEKDETDEEELLQAESEHDGTVEQYLVESDKERQAEPHVDPIDAFLQVLQQQ